MAWRSFFLASLFNLAFLASQQVAHAEGPDLADLLGGAGQALGVAGETAKNLGKTAASSALSRAGTVATVGEAGIHAKNGRIPEMVGSLVEGAVGVMTIPGGAFAGSTVAPGPGTLAGAYGGSMIAKHAGNQAEQLTRETLDKFRDTRTNLQKRMDRVGLDHKAFADDFGDLRQLGEAARYEAELRKELMELEKQQAERRGESYIPDAMLTQEIAELEQYVSEVQQPSSAIPYAADTPPQDCAPMSEDEKASIIAVSLIFSRPIESTCPTD